MQHRIASIVSHYNFLILLPIFVYLSFSRLFFQQPIIKYGAFATICLCMAAISLVILKERIRTYVYAITLAFISSLLILSLYNRLHENFIFYALIANFIFIFYYAQCYVENIQQKNFLRFIFVFCIALIPLLILELLQRYFDLIFFTDIRSVGNESYIREFYRLSGSTTNPNRWAASIAIPIFMALFCYLKSKSNILLMLFLILATYAALSFSKTFILSSLITCSLILILMRKTKYIILVILSAIVITSGLGLTFNDEAARIFDAQIEILQSPRDNATIENRLESYKKALDALKENPFIGLPINDLEISPHNNLLAHVAYYGIFGVLIYFIIFIIPLLLFIKKANKKRDKKVMVVILIGGLLSSSMSSLATDVSSQLMYLSGLILSVYLLQYAQERAPS